MGGKNPKSSNFKVESWKALAGWRMYFWEFPRLSSHAGNCYIHHHPGDKELPRAGNDLPHPKSYCCPWSSTEKQSEAEQSCSSISQSTKEASRHFRLYILCLCLSLAKQVPCRVQLPGSQGTTFPACWPLQYKIVCLGLVLIYQVQSLYPSSGTRHARPTPVKAGCTHPLHWSATPPDLFFKAVLTHHNLAF